MDILPGERGVIVRDARRDDVPEIVALLADDVLGAGREAGLDEAYWAAFEQMEGDPRNRLIVAEDSGRVAGTLQLTLIPGLSRHGMLRAQIEGVRVAAEYRGQGLGRELIRWAVGEARRAGCGMVQLTSDKQRADAIRFYESLGFAATHEGLKLALLGQRLEVRAVQRPERARPAGRVTASPASRQDSRIPGNFCWPAAASATARVGSTLLLITSCI